MVVRCDWCAKRSYVGAHRVKNRMTDCSLFSWWFYFSQLLSENGFICHSLQHHHHSCFVQHHMTSTILDPLIILAFVIMHMRRDDANFECRWIKLNYYKFIILWSLNTHVALTTTTTCRICIDWLRCRNNSRWSARRRSRMGQTRICSNWCTSGVRRWRDWLSWWWTTRVQVIRSWQL